MTHAIRCFTALILSALAATASASANANCDFSVAKAKAIVTISEYAAQNAFKVSALQIAQLSDDSAQTSEVVFRFDAIGVNGVENFVGYHRFNGACDSLESLIVTGKDVELN